MDNKQQHPDLPLGFGMALAQDAAALNQFGTCSLSKQHQIVNYIQSSTTGEDAKERIRNVVENLKSGDVPQMF